MTDETGGVIFVEKVDLDSPIPVEILPVFAFSTLRMPFPLPENAFAVLENAFSSMEKPFAVLEKPFAEPENAFAVL